jgi:hypothetical protein
VQLKARFNGVVILFAAIGYLILAAHHYLTTPTTISDFTRNDFFYIFGILFALASKYRASSLLRESLKTSGDTRRVDVDLAINAAAETGNRQVSFGAAIRKRPGLLAVVLVFFFSLPFLLQLGGRTHHGINWQAVVIGELLMAIVLTIGWFGAKRKFDKSVRR